MGRTFRSGRLGLLLSAISVWTCAAALADGRIEGQVSSSAGGAYLKGAVVRIAELNLEFVTEADGRFTFPSVPSGSYDLTVNYIGFSPHSAVIDVWDDETTVHAVAFEKPLEEMVVYGKQTASTAAALNQQRAADGIVSVVSATDIGQFPDRNVSEALQRVSGVFLERDQGRDGSSAFAASIQTSSSPPSTASTCRRRKTTSARWRSTSSHRNCCRRWR